MSMMGPAAETSVCLAAASFLFIFLLAVGCSWQDWNTIHQPGMEKGFAGIQSNIAGLQLSRKSEYLVAKADSCNADSQTDQMAFEECSDEVLQGTVSSRHWRTKFTAAWTGPQPKASHTFPAKSESSKQPFGRFRGQDDNSQEERQKPVQRFLWDQATGVRGPANTPPRQLLWVIHVAYCTWQVNRLAKAVASSGIPLAVLGTGTFWKWRWGYRMRLLHDFLVNVPDDYVVVFTDSGDVIPAPSASPEKMLQRYDELVALHKGPRIFFAAEFYCFPQKDLWSKYQDPKDIPGGKGDSPFRYLNAGSLIGPAGLIRQMIAVVYQGDCFDDQDLYTLAHLDPLLWWADPKTGETTVKSKENTPPDSVPATAGRLIGLDHWNNLFAAINGVNASDYEMNAPGGGVRISSTKGEPMIFHENGDKSRQCMLDFLSREFGYKNDATRALHCEDLRKNATA